MGDDVHFLAFSAPWFKESLAGRARIGIPFNYNFFAATDIDHRYAELLGEKMRISEQNWIQSDAGKSLVQSLLLSDDAKKYGICLFMQLRCSYWPIIEAVLPVLCGAIMCLVYEFTHLIFQGLIGKKANLVLIPCLVASGYSLNLTIGSFIHNFIVRVSEKDIMADIYAHFKTGAPEYYEKLIQRNKAMRALVDNGKRYYNARGEAISWRDKESRSLEARLEKAKKRLEKIEHVKKPGETV